MTIDEHQMKPIQEVVQALGDVSRALVPYEGDPWQRPIIPVTVTEGAGSGEVLVDMSEEWDYPDWVERETWDALDRDVFEHSDLPAASSRAAGIDALAWYVSFHYTGGGPWGIFIPVSSLGYCENRIFRGLRATRAGKWHLAYDALLAHEQMHFAVDYASAQWEVLLHAPSWAGLHERMRVDSVPYLQVEEQLANAFMLQCSSSWKPKSFDRALRESVAKEPPGYRDALSVTDRDSFEHVAAEVVKIYIGLHAVERGLNVTASVYDLAALLPARTGMTQCPVHIIHDEDRMGLPRSAVQLITRICNIRESERFHRRYQSLDRTVQRSWSAMKERLSAGVPRSARLEKMKGLPGDVFSVRIGDNFRVHLQPDGREGWEAMDIGSHKEMGHG